METEKNVTPLELTRDTVNELSNEPHKYYCKTLKRTVHIKRLRIRDVIKLVRDTGGEGALDNNVEALLQLATKSLCDRDGNLTFNSIDDCELVIGHAINELQYPLMEVQGLGVNEKK